MDPALLDLVDSDSAEEVHNAVQAMLQKAKNDGLPVQYHRSLDQIVQEHYSVFCTNLSSDPPADIPPLATKLRKGAKPTGTKLRNYSQARREFMINTLLENGMVYRNPTSAWESSPLLAPKSGPAQLRFTVYLRPVNHYPEKHGYPMPNVELELQTFSD